MFKCNKHSWILFAVVTAVVSSFVLLVYPIFIKKHILKL